MIDDDDDDDEEEEEEDMFSVCIDDYWCVGLSFVDFQCTVLTPKNGIWTADRTQRVLNFCELKMVIWIDLCIVIHHYLYRHIQTIIDIVDPPSTHTNG